MGNVSRVIHATIIITKEENEPEVYKTFVHVNHSINIMSSQNDYRIIDMYLTLTTFEDFNILKNFQFYWPFVKYSKPFAKSSDRLSLNCSQSEDHSDIPFGSKEEFQMTHEQR